MPAFPRLLLCAWPNAGSSVRTCCKTTGEFPALLRKGWLGSTPGCRMAVRISHPLSSIRVPVLWSHFFCPLKTEDDIYLAGNEWMFIWL